MKHYKAAIIFAALMLMLCTTSCRHDISNELRIPDPEMIEKVEWELCEDGVVSGAKPFEGDFKIWIEKMLDGLKSSRDSVNETPVNVDRYFTVRMHPVQEEMNTSPIHIYSRNGKYYIEQPYAGIWRVSKDIYLELIEEMED
jgi:hypothetical protein